ncbi:hypothetical protein E4U51_000879 [Claviceps purpurea]|nr:hypothetical protein E4U51_000879 [Claviceps purpurea]
MGMSPEPTDKSKSLLLRPAVITQAFAAMVRKGIRYGLAQLHQRGVMHRDVAPRNMMMLYDDRTGRYMVIDLELSEPIDGGVPAAMDVHIEKGKRK